MERAVKRRGGEAAGKGARKSVRWSMHEQFEEDLKADLADAQKRDLPTSGLALSTALVNPKLVSGVNAAVNSLLEVISPGSSELVPNAAEGAAKDTNSGGKSEKTATTKSGKKIKAKPRASKEVGGGGGGGGGGAETETDGNEPDDEATSITTSATPAAAAMPHKPKPQLRKGDSGNLRKMLLERRKSSTGRSSQELLHMLNILEGDEEDDGQPDELVLCRLCEQQVLRSSLQLHTAVCKAAHKAKSDDEAVNREVKELAHASRIDAAPGLTLPRDDCSAASHAPLRPAREAR